MNEQYIDDFKKIEAFPHGKLFRLTYDSDGDMLRIIAKNQTILDELVEAFTVDNPAAFYSQQYGYAGEPKLYNVNPFGYFSSGLLFDILEWIKTQYGSLRYLAVSAQCANYIADFVKPLERYITNQFEITDLIDDVGTNIEKFEKRAYQDEAVDALFRKGFGRGLIEIPTAGGKSYILANFIWNVICKFNSNAHVMVIVPSIQLVDQLQKDFCEYGIQRQLIARLRGGMSKKEKRENDVSKAQIVIASRQSLQDHLKEIPPPDVLICDECLREGSFISTIDGVKKIEDIKKDDLVLSYNEKECLYEYKEVEQIHRNLKTSNSYDYFLEIELDDGKKITVTPNHKFFTKNRGYVRADELTFEDDLVIQD